MTYNPALDGIRALSILLVVLFHCRVPGFGGGFAGLDIFFVLSGYLITSLLLAELRDGSIEVGRFYARRALRLYPTLLLMLVVYICVAPVLWPSENRWLSAALAASYMWDYALAFLRLPFTIAHTWSLGVEEKFYLLWPLLLPVVARTRRPVAWLLAAFFAVTAWRYFVALKWNWPQAYFSFDTRMSGILLGAIAAFTRFEFSRLTLAFACVALGIATMMPSLPTQDQTRAVTLSITLAELSAFVLVCHAAQRGVGSAILASRPMAYIGRLSYGIFIWHFPVTVLLVRTQPTWLTVCATLLFSFTMAAICLHWLDMPIKRWRERSWARVHHGAGTMPLGNR
jgi:peptidoglycan/LPS O-acetylase OafA/YrhL